jgi:hypothetical protein|eukprot:5223032-Prymnesium_polylepis.1
MCFCEFSKSFSLFAFFAFFAFRSAAERSAVVRSQVASQEPGHAPRPACLPPVYGRPSNELRNAVARVARSDSKLGRAFGGSERNSSIFTQSAESREEGGSLGSEVSSPKRKEVHFGKSSEISSPNRELTSIFAKYLHPIRELLQNARPKLRITPRPAARGPQVSDTKGGSHGVHQVHFRPSTVLPHGPACSHN